MSIQLVMTTESGEGRVFDIHDNRTTIGRRRSCDLHVALPSVAPLHCEITVKEGIIKLMNRDPDAHTLHNGTEIDAVQLENSDRVKIGPVEFTVIISEEETVIKRH